MLSYADTKYVNVYVTKNTISIYHQIVQEEQTLGDIRRRMFQCSRWNAQRSLCIAGESPKLLLNNKKRTR